MAHRGAYIFKVDACETMNPYDPDVDHTPELISVATTNSVQIPISEDTAASVGCTPFPSCDTQMRCCFSVWRLYSV